MITIELDKKSKDLAKNLRHLSTKQVNRASYVAINRTLTHARKTLSVDARVRYVAKAGPIKASMELERANGGNLSGSVISTGRQLSLSAFQTTAYKRGPVGVRIIRQGKGEKMQRVPGMIKKDWPSGYSGVMMRTSKNKYPLKTPGGPSVPQMVGNEEVLKSAAPEIGEFLNERFQHEIEHRFGVLCKTFGGETE